MRKYIVFMGLAVACALILWLWREGTGPAETPLQSSGEVVPIELPDAILTPLPMRTDERVANEVAEHAEQHVDSSATLVTLPGNPQPIDLHVIVTDRETAVPVVGAQVMRKGVELAVTDADGRTSCAWDTTSRDDLFSVVAHGYGKAFGRVDMEAGGPEHPILIELARSATLYGHVKGLVGAGPFAARVTTDGNLLLSEWPFYEPSLRDTAWHALIDPRGRFEFFDLPPDVPLAIAFKEQDVEPRPLQLEKIVLESGEVRELEWDLAADSSVAGRVTDPDGRGLAGVPVRLQVGLQIDAFRPQFGDTVAQTETDEQGGFQFDGLAAGHYLIGVDESRASLDEIVLRATPLAIELRAGLPITDAHLIAHTGMYIEGRVLSVAGLGQAQITVIARASATNWEYAISAADGRFSIGPVIPGEYEVEAILAEELDAAMPPPVHVVAPASAIEIQLIEGGVVVGRIMDLESGAALSGIVALQTGRGIGTRIAGGRGAAGFEFTSTAPGEYALLAVASDGRVGIVENVRLESGEETVDVDVPVLPSGVLLVNIEERTGEFLRARVGSIDLHDISSPDSTTAHFQAPAGPVTLELVRRSPNLDAALEEVRVRRVVEVPDGETLEVQLDD
jgi:hypothetical protein